jgi:hypothetical protein
MEKGNEDKGKIKDTIGFIVFLIIFVIIVPMILYYKKRFNVMEVYLPNIDNIAHILTWIGGPMNIWSNLYLPYDKLVPELTTRTIINYLALSGITFIVARESAKSGNMYEGWSFGLIILVTTYFLAGPTVISVMDHTNSLMTNFKFDNTVGKIMGGIFGVGTITLFIFVEILIIKYYRKNIASFSKNIINKKIPNIITYINQILK